MINQNQPKDLKIYERPFEERKIHGDRAEDCFAEYLKKKYCESSITYRQKEKEVDYKLPDFSVKTQTKTFEFEVKSTTKIKYRDYQHQLQYATEQKLVLFYIYMPVENGKCLKFRPIEAKDLLDYRVLFKDSFYNDTIPKPYFVIDPYLFHGKSYEKDWIYLDSLFPTS